MVASYTSAMPPAPMRRSMWYRTQLDSSIAMRMRALRTWSLAGILVSCAPAEALQQQFEHLQPNFIAVHDIATSSSRKLLTGIAAASGRAVQKLVIRRQGYGTALATVEFVELPTADNQLLRLYTTEADAFMRGLARHPATANN